MCGGYDPAVKDRICLKAIGTNGYLELMEAFAEFDSDVLYGACVFYTVSVVLASAKKIMPTEQSLTCTRVLVLGERRAGTESFSFSHTWGQVSLA